MPDWLTLHVIAMILNAALFGGMLFFIAVFSPLVFSKLSRPAAADFMRGVFPVYYRLCGILALVTALPLVPAHAYMAEVSVLVLVAGGFVLANVVLRPALERARANDNDAGVRRLHLTSVVLHLIQFAAVAFVFIRLAQ